MFLTPWLNFGSNTLCRPPRARKLSRRTSSRRRRQHCPNAVECLEDRTLLSAEFAWAAGFGSTGLDSGFGVTTDAAGNVYATGVFEGTVDFDPTASHAGNVDVLTTAGSRDIFVLKLDTAGNFVWARRMGGTGLDAGFQIALDSMGNVYTAGSFQGTADFDPTASHAGNVDILTSAGLDDAFVTKLDSAGNFVWAKQMGGASSDGIASIAVDGADNVYTMGGFFGTADWDPTASHAGNVDIFTSAGAADVIVSKLDSAGNFVWAKQMGGTGDDRAASQGTLALDITGNVYITGQFQGTADFDPTASHAGNADILTSAGEVDVFVSKLDSAGNFVWAKRMGGTAPDGGLGVAVDGAANVYATGTFSGTVDFDPTASHEGNVDILTSAGSGDGFVLKLDSAGNFVWAKRAGGTAFDQPLGITVDGAGDIYTTGTFHSGTADFDPAASHAGDVDILTSAGGSDIFLWKLDSAGNFADALRMGGTATFDTGNDIEVDGAGNIYTTGQFGGTADFDPGSGAFDLTASGIVNAFVSKLTQNQPPMADGGSDQTVGGGSTTILDGSGSSDGDGEIVSYSWDFGDGTGYSETAGDAPDGAFDGMTTHSYSDDGTFTVTLTVTDDQGATSSSATTVTVLNVDPTVNGGGDTAISEGDTFLGAGSFADPETDTWTATVDYGDGSGVQPLALNPDKTFNLSHVYADNGSYAVTITVTDDDGGSGSDTFQVTVLNVAPSVAAGPDQTVNEGQLVSLTPSTFVDPGTADTHTATIDWGDGTATEAGAVTETPFGPPGSTSGAVGTVSGSHVYADNGSYTVTITVTDDELATTTNTFQVTVLNVAPTMDPVVGPTAGVRGQPLHFTFAASDLSSADEGAGLEFTIDWGDGSSTPVAAVVGQIDTTLTHIYTDTGMYTVTVTATDKDGGLSAPTAHGVTITVVALQADSWNPGETALAVGGTLGNDLIVFSVGSGAGEVEVRLDGASLGTFAPTSRLLAYGQAGNDDIRVSSNIALAALLSGDAGNDRLRGGAGHDVILGGIGDDLVVGGSGRDLLVGGLGSDRILGNADEDILVAGRLIFDDLDAALCAVMHEWTSARDYATRIQNLTDGTGSLDRENGQYVLRTGETVVEDDNVDFVNGNSGLDWFFFDPDRDMAVSSQDEIFANDLDFILAS